MNTVPVLKSKLIMPELPANFLFTDRLDKLHTAMDASSAVSVCAPAGYGKTTLAVSYFNRKTSGHSRICWYRLDPEDRNLPVFIAHLTETLFPSKVTPFAGSRIALKEYAEVELQPQQVIAMICQEMWYHHSHSATRTYIVLDDFQNVIQTPEICDIAAFMLDNLPLSCTVIVLNRAYYKVFTEKQKLEHKVLEIGAEDLAFSTTEISDYLFHMEQPVNNQKIINFIRKRTEGWIAGVVILCQAIKSKGSDFTAIERGKLGHEDALFRYLSLEVLKSVDTDTQDALARLAMLQDFSEFEASEIFGIINIEDLMAQSMGLGIFIQRIHGDPVVYRFHSLFRDFLLQILKRRCTGEKLSELHLKAAAYYIGTEVHVRAADHLAKCGNATLAMDMVTNVGFNKFLIGETAQLKIWLDLLPEDMIYNNPVLLMYKAQLLPNNRQGEMVEPLKRLLQLFLRNNEPEMYFHVLSVLVYIFTCSNDMNGLHHMTTGLSWQLDKPSEELKNTLAILDMVQSIAKERFPVAAAQSESIRYDLLPMDDQWLYLILSSIIYHCLGKLDQAEHCMETALVLHHLKNIEPARGFILLFLAIALSLKNEKDRLPSLTSEITAIGEKYDYDYLTANGKRLAAFERYLSFDTEVSLEMLDFAVYHFRRMNNKVMASSCGLLKQLWSVRPGGTGFYLEEARREVAVIRKNKPGLMVYETSLSILGALARESGDYPLAERSLLSAIRSAKAKKAYQVLCGSYYHLAKLYFMNGSTEKAHGYLKQAMELASRNRYFMFWDIHIPTLTEMVLRSLRWGYCPDFANKLLERIYNKDTAKYLKEKVKAMDENRISSFVDHFTDCYKADQEQELYLVKATLFGKPDISINGIPIPNAEWKTKKNKGLMEYLLLNSPRPVAKEALLDIFWPNSDGKSAMVSLRTALYQLRKTLAKYNVKVSDNNAFIHETLAGLQIRNTDVLELDLEEFLRLSQELKAAPAKNTPTTKNTRDANTNRTKKLERMVSLYRGVLMDDSDYGGLVSLERERCKVIFENACMQLGLIYVNLGEAGRAEEILKRALAMEPYSENICLELLRLFMQQGMRSKAVNLYYRFKKRFEKDLGIEVDRKLKETLK